MAPCSICIERPGSFFGFGIGLNGGNGGNGGNGNGNGGNEGIGEIEGNGNNGGHNQSNGEHTSSNRDDSSSSDEKTTKTIVHQVTFTSVQTSILSVTVSPTPTEANDSNPTASPTVSFFTPPASSPPVIRPTSSTSNSAATPSGTSITLPSSNARLPAASIISIILSGLFFITLCLVIYVRNPTLPGRILGIFKRRQSRPAIRSFEPIEYNSTRNDGLRQSFLSHLPFGHWRRPSSKAAEAFSSPARPSPSYINNGLQRGTPLMFSKAVGSDQPRSLSAFSGFDDQSFAGGTSEESRASVKLSDWYSTTSYTPYSIPRSVDQMTAE